MASSSENISMAVFCDFENVALGVRDANYDKFDIKLVLERLLLKGSIVVKKAYCDWDRYKSFKGTMHEANFELIEIPHVRQSGKNSADIRMVVDALDLCYTKAHVDTFVIVSGDSDFSPLVSKLRENAKRVIGVGVKQSTSDLLVANCDEFIFYDDLVREVRRAAAKRDERKAQPQAQQQPAQSGRRPSDEGNRKREEMEARRVQALEMVVETFDALVSERGDSGKIWASLLKDTLKRRRPDFSEIYYGFRTFGNLLEEAQTRGLFEFGRDEKSGTYVFRSASAQAELVQADVPGTDADTAAPESAVTEPEQTVAEQLSAQLAEAAGAPRESRRRGGRGRSKGREAQAPAAAPTDLHAADGTLADWPAPTPDLAEGPAGDAEAEVETEAETAPADAAATDAVAAVPAEADDVAAAATDAAPAAKERRRAPRAPRKPAARKGAAVDAVQAAAAVDVVPEAPAPEAPAPAPGTTATPDAVAADDSADAPDVDGNVAVDDSADASDVDGNVAVEVAGGGRKKSSRPPHKPAARAPRRPAKSKTPSDNG